MYVLLKRIFVVVPESNVIFVSIPYLSETESDVSQTLIIKSLVGEKKKPFSNDMIKHLIA